MSITQFIAGHILTADDLNNNFADKVSQSETTDQSIASNLTVAGLLKAKTPTAGDNSTNVATTAFVANSITASGNYNASAVAITGGTIGNTTITSGKRTGGTIDGAVIGGTTAEAGTFTSLSATSGSFGSLVASEIDAIIGANTPQSGTFSSLTMAIGGALTLSADPTTALQAATKQYADKMLPLAGGTMTGALTVPSFTLGSTPLTLGTGVGNTLGPLTSASGFPKLVTGPRLIFQSGTTSATDVNNFQFDRVASFTGGTSANINSNMRITTTVGANNGSREWNLLSIVNSSGATGTGLPVAGYFQGNRLSGGKDHQWALISDVKDQSGLSSSASGTPGLVSFELDISANGADDATNSASFGGVGNRTGLDIVAFRYNTGDTTQTQFSHGIWFTTADAHVNYGSALSFGVNTQTYSALDTRGAIAPTGSSNPVNAVVMSAGHVIDFNGGSSLNSAPGNYLQYSSSNAALSYFSGASEVVRFEDKTNSSYFDFSYSSVGNTMQLGVGGSPANLRLQASGAGAVQINSTLILLSALNQHVNVFTTTGNYTATSTDNIIVINKTTGAATQVTLPSSPSTGRIITVKDGKGDCSVNNITIVPDSGTIDGSANVVLNVNYASVDLVYNGSEWGVI